MQTDTKEKRKLRITSMVLCVVLLLTMIIGWFC